jgi:hypothetical protein
MVSIFSHDGNCVFEGLWSTITASKGFDTNLLNIPKDATHWVRYTGGATAALVPGEAVHGNTSAAIATLVAQAVEVGTAGSSDTGLVFLKDVSGVWVAETMHAAGSNGAVTIAQAPIELQKGLQHPKALLIVAETEDLIVTISGLLPTATAGTNHGTLIPAGMSEVFRGINNIKNFRVINAVNANGALCHYRLYF